MDENTKNTDGGAFLGFPDGISEKQRELINVTGEFKKRLGRPIRDDSGTYLVTCSLPTIWRSVVKKYHLSPTECLREGVLLKLNMLDDFPQTEYEGFLVTGLYVAHKKRFIDVIAKLGGHV